MTRTQAEIEDVVQSVYKSFFARYGRGQFEFDDWSDIWGLVQLYQAALYSDRPDPSTPGAFFRYVCIIESPGRTTGLRQSFTQSEGQERVLQIRWETAIKGPGPGPSFGPGGVSNI